MQKKRTKKVKVGKKCEQKEKTINVQFGKNGQPDQAALQSVLVDDVQHRARSTKALNITKQAEKKYKLPEMARDGGQHSANPHTREQRRLTRGPFAPIRIDTHACCSGNPRHQLIMLFNGYHMPACTIACNL